MGSQFNNRAGLSGQLWEVIPVGVAIPRRYARQVYLGVSLEVKDIRHSISSFLRLSHSGISDFLGGSVFM